MAEVNFCLPPQLEMRKKNMADQFWKWKRQLEIYMDASNGTNKTVKTHSLPTFCLIFFFIPFISVTVIFVSFL